MTTNSNAFVKTTDWWCGNYYQDGTSFYDRYGMDAEHPNTKDALQQGMEYVEVKLIDCRQSSKPEWQFVRVAVWGNDDMGMERDFKAAQYEQAQELYEDLRTSPVISFDILKSKGFQFS